jgi:hypothetical protein
MYKTKYFYYSIRYPAPLMVILPSLRPCHLGRFQHLLPAPSMLHHQHYALYYLNILHRISSLIISKIC